MQKPDDIDTLTVRARTQGDIESVFADAYMRVWSAMYAHQDH